jgi:O-antigen/teichoic acid export membrane protein
LINREKLYYLLGLIGSRAPFFLLIPILSFYFNKSQVGKIDLILVTVTLLIPLISLQLGEATFRFLKQFITSRSKIISTALIGLALNSLIFVIVSYLVFIWFGFEEIIWFAIIFISSFLVNNLLLVYRGLNNIKSYALLGVLSGSISLILIFSLLRLDTSILEISFFFGIGHLIAIVVSLFESSVLKNISFLKFNKKLLYSLLLYSLPLIPNAISWWFTDLGNRYVIKFALGEEALGIFAVAARYIVMIAFINNFFLLLWQDDYLEEKTSEMGLKSNFDQYIKIQLSIIIFVISISYYLIKLGAGEEFIDSYKYVGPIGLSLFFSSLSAYAGVEYLKTKKTKLLFFSTLKGALANTILAIVLVNFIGLYGIVLSSIIGFLFTFYLRLKGSIKLRNFFDSIKKQLSIGFLIMLFVYLIQLFGSPLIIILTFIIVFIGLLNWNKKFILNIITK